ncbi:MAG: exodeoxyribonuclease III [Bacteroidota bacterium]|jgi:exodeoxyribonuclease-3
MDIVSYNVNGIRSAIGKGLLNWMESRKADVYCFQETKADKSQVDLSAFELLGYNSYWFSAEKKGYSGVAIFTKHQPKQVRYGFGHADYDKEGRAVQVDFDGLSVMSVYIPSGTTGDERQAFKMNLLSFFDGFVAQRLEETPHLLVCGDYNICHQPIDIHDPVSNKNSSGFLPEEREWLSRFMDGGFIDTFRHFNKDPHHYSWWTFRANARANNKGWRIDYCMAHQPLLPRLKDAGIHADVVHSDHCPIWVRVD